MPILTVRRANASGPGRTLRFGQKTILVGRSPNCTICLKDGDVSPVHFEVSWRPDTGWTLVRHESAQPVLVNDASVDTWRLLGGETIRVGSFALEYEGDEADDQANGMWAAPASGEESAGEPSPITLGEPSTPRSFDVDTSAEEPPKVLVRTVSARRSAVRPSSSVPWTVGLLLTGLAGAALSAIFFLSNQNGLRRDVAHKEGRRPRSTAERSDPRPTPRNGEAIDAPRRAAGSEQKTAASPPTAADAERSASWATDPPVTPRPARTRGTAPAGRAAPDTTGSSDAREVPGSLAGLLSSAEEDGPAPADGQAPAKPSRQPGQAAAAPAESAVGDAPAKRLAIPDAAQVEPAKAEVLAAYGDELAGGLDAGDMTGRLIDAARESTRPASKYALLDAAEATALRSGSYRQAVAVIDARSQMFEIDNLESRLAMLMGVAKGATPKDREAFDLAVDTVRDALRGERFEVASKAVALSVTLSGPLDPSAAKAALRLRTIVNECKALQRKYKAALVSLADNPQDPRAREVVGAYACFVKQDWKEGVASLAVGRDEQLKAIAVRELAALSEGTEVADMFALGNAWWAYAEPQARASDVLPWYQEVVRGHAAEIYRRIVDKISDPVEETLARKRIELGSGW